MTYTEDQVKALAIAMWQLLDDMGETGLSVCLEAKEQAIVAFNSFKEIAAEAF